MVTVVNFYGGPSVGKSTCAMQTTVDLKKARIKADYVPEVAKALTYERRMDTLAIQPYVTVKQYRDIYRVAGQVDFVVTDGPLIQGIFYNRKYPSVISTTYDNFLLDLHKNCGKSVNILLKREFDYEEYGRNQTKEEAFSYDFEIEEILKEFEIDYIVMKPSEVSLDVLRDLGVIDV